MTQSRLVLSAAVAALMFGVTGAVAAQSEQGAAVAQQTLVIAADDAAPADDTEENAEDSAKMGKDEGTHAGPDLGATPENDTSKVDQPARRNSTTGGASEDDNGDNAGDDADTGEGEAAAGDEPPE